MKKLICLTLAILMCATFFVGCSDDVVYSGTTETTANSDSQSQDGTNDDNKGETMNYESKPTDAILDINTIELADEDVEVEDDYAIREPEKGETVAIMHTNMGDISIRLLDKIAPLATNNFIALSENGRYDNTVFHRVINDFMIQGGDYTNFNGTGGASAYGVEFADEFHECASNIRGSLSMANAGPTTNGSQFFINQSHAGNTYLDGVHTVFGWVYDGMDVVDAIAATPTDYSDRPIEDVVIEYIEITKY